MGHIDRRRVAALVRAETAILRSNRGIAVTVASPIGMLYIVRPAFELYGRVSGTPSPMMIAGPAVASMWAFFLLSYVGFAFFRDRFWHTSDRLLVSGATRVEISIGKLLPLFVIGMLHQAAALLSASLFYGIDTARTVVALMLVGTLFVVVLLLLALALVGLFSTLRSVTVAQSLAIMIGGAAGGAITPRELLPGWIQTAGKCLPNYWSQQGYTSVLRNGVSPDLVGPVLVLSVFGTLFGVVAALASRRVKRTTSWV